MGTGDSDRKLQSTEDSRYQSSYLRYVLHSYCKMLPEDWIGSKPKPVLAGKKLDEADRSFYLDSYF